VLVGVVWQQVGVNGMVLGVLYLGEDITESKEVQRQGQALDRMAARGQVAAEVAHELNNYISILSGNLELLPIVLEGGDKERIEKKLDAMRNSVKRMTVFTNGLMNFAAPKYDFCEVELNNFLEGELAFLRPQKRFRNIKIVSECDDRIGMIAADPGGLQQILYNLVNNAADAFNNARRKDGVISVKTELRDDESISIIVSDNGPGMPGEELEKAFKRSFTTKTSGHGYGLPTIKSIALAHNGRVAVESEPGKGTKFSIILPVKQQFKSVASETKIPVSPEIN